MNCNKLKHCLLAVLLGATLTGEKLVATPVNVPDYSFELWTNPVTGFGLPDGTTTAGPDVGPSWKAAGNGGINLVNPTNGLFAGTTGSPGTLPPTGDGTNYLFIGLGNPAANGYCWQTIGTLQPNTIYTLTVAVGNTLFADGGQGSINLMSGSFPNGTVIASAAVDSTTLTPGTFGDSTLVFVTGQIASGPYTILLEGTGSIQTNELVYDNVRLDASPAPAMADALTPSASPGTNVFVGTLVTLNENPAGTAPFTYQWQTDNGSGGAVFSNISGATATNLIVDTSAFSGTPIEYQVIVSNTAGVSTSPVVILTASQGAPIIVADTLPASGSDVVGSQITFSAVFDGTRPLTYQWFVQDTNGDPAVAISGATSSTLTLSNLQLTDYAIYSCTASNALGTTPSTAVVFTVNPVPPATNNIVVELANQTGLGGNTTFSPSWTITTNNDLLAGLLPSTVGPGNFSDPQEKIAGTPAVLTDGKFGKLYPGGITSPDVITGGTPASGAGQYLVYTLPFSPTGWDLTNLVVYGGWADAGRDEQRYVAYYSTVAAPSNFTAFANVTFNPSNPHGVQSATRSIVTPSGAPAIVKNVAALKFDFSNQNPGAENGFVGYSEIQAYGTPSANTPILASDTEPLSASDVVGDTFTFSATITGATSSQWYVVSGGTTNAIAGATNQTLVLPNLQLTDSASYYLVGTNSSGSATSSQSALVVNPAGNAFLSGSGTVIASGANQTGRGSTFTPNWVIGTNNDLILGASPTATGGGVFNSEGSGGIPVLTDGKFGSVGAGINSSLATVGNAAGGGHSVTYTLTGSASGFDITNIVSYGGWSDGGRDQQGYTVSYSTVLAPSTFNTIATAGFNPTLPGAVPSAVRLSFTSTSGPLATNVAQIKFDFTNPLLENGYTGCAELDVLGQASAPLPIAPYITSDIIPATGSDVVGSSVTFKASFNGTAPITYQWQTVAGGVTNPIPGATSSTLTLANLQIGNTGAYQLQASNSVGVGYSSLNSFTVNPAPSPNGNGVIVAPANQTGNGAFTPTWTVAPGSLIAGTLPSGTGAGSFTQEGAGGLPVLTDGLLNLFGSTLAGLATCGSVGGGHTLIYTLTNYQGYNLSSIVSYGGWNDGGRDQQAYTVSYSTVASPSTFTTIAVANYNPSLPGTVPSADRVTMTSATASPIASNVSAVKFDFTNPAGENGYSGYAEFQLFGSSAAPAPPKLNAPQAVGGNLVLTGSGGSVGGSYKILTTTNVTTPLSGWTTNTTGVFDSSGNFSNSIPISSSVTARFFLLKTP